MPFLVIARALLEERSSEVTVDQWEDAKHTKSGQDAGDGSVVGITGGLVLSQDTTTDTLDNTNLGRLLIIQLAQAEGELAKLLDDLGESLSGARALEAVGGGGTAVESGTVREGLDLSGSERQTKLNTPDFTDLGDTLTLDTSAGREDDLLLAFDLVAVKQPAGGVLDNVAVVGLGDLLNQLSDLSLGRRLLGSGLLLLLISSAGEQARGNHKSQEKLVGVVSGVDKVSLAAGHHIGGRVAVGDNDHVANDGTEAIDLSTKLDLGDLTGLQGGLGLLSVGHQGSVGSHIGAGRDRGGVSDTFPRRITLTR